jgi:hypothetical protein
MEWLLMDWLLVAIIGAAVGFVISFFAQGIRMPQALCVVLALAGSLAGAGLIKISGLPIFGIGSFYIAGCLGAICLLAGGILAFSLTQDEHRI